jgi:hypothetical protein
VTGDCCAEVAEEELCERSSGYARGGFSG